MNIHNMIYFSSSNYRATNIVTDTVRKILNLENAQQIH